MCPKCFRPPAQGKGCQDCHGHQTYDGVIAGSYQALIVSLFNRSELDYLFASLDQLEGGRGGRGEALPSFILPVIRTQACPALVLVLAVLIVPKLTIISVAGTLPVSDQV